MGKSSDHPVPRSADLVVIPCLYAIIDPTQGNGRSLVEMATALLAAGVRLIQLRDKYGASGELYVSAGQVGECVRKWGGTFVVNDRADIACAVDADGVHVGQDDLPVESVRAMVGADRLVGCSTHNLEQVEVADRSTADYIAFGPIFPTPTKENTDPVVGLVGLAEARKATSKPLVAIGGITLDNARAVMEAGANSVAVIRGLVGAPGIRQRAEEFLEKVRA